MSSLTHLVGSWLVASVATDNARDRKLVTIAGILPDADGLGAVVDVFGSWISGKEYTFHYYQQFHHLWLHGWPGAMAISLLLALFGKDRWRVLLLSLVTFHLHLLCDLIGSRGPSPGDLWPICYSEPLFRHPIWFWKNQWRLDGWQNRVIFLCLFGFALAQAVRMKHSFVELLGAKADSAFVEVLGKWCAQIFKIKMPSSVLVAGVAASSAMHTLAVGREIPPAFGPHVNLAAKDFAEATTFTSTNKLVGTYYFYWYDIYSGSHIRNDDGSDALTTHPATLDDFSYASVRWHKKQLADMEAAGIDLALMVFWGSPAEHETNTVLHWSFAGLPPLVQAREELLREGHHPPRIGLFYDTSTLQHNEWHYHADLTTDLGKKYFYATVRDFFSCIPPKHWAMLEGKPIVLMYAAAFAAKWDQSFIDYTKTEFAKEFGGRVPWIAPQDSWNVKGDATSAWGGALAFRNPGIGEIGPGYDHSAVPGRKPLVRDREDGRFYEQSWQRFLRKPSGFVMIETWNEFHEGTDIAESKESGRKYIELTRKYSDMFKRGEKPPWPTGKFSGARAVGIQLGATNVESGLRQLECEDGTTAPAHEAGREARRVTPFQNSSRYLYFAVDDSFKPAEPMNGSLEVDYLDARPGTLLLEFDGGDSGAPLQGAYSPSATVVKLAGDHRWKTARFELRGARWFNSQNGGADFRLVGETAELVVSRVRLLP